MTIQQMLQAGLEHQNAGRLAEAEQLYQQVLNQKPNHPDALHMLGSVAWSVGRNDLAVQLISRAVELAPHWATYRASLGLALEGLGRHDEAIAQYRQALANRPQFPEALSNLGNALFSQNKPDQAIDCYRRAIELRPDFADAHNNLGNALRQRGEFEAAIESFHKALRPDFPEAYYNLAHGLLSAQRFSEAIEQYRIAIQIRPNYTKAWNNLGNALKETGQAAQAIAVYREALAKNPSLHGAHSNLLYALHLDPDAKPEEIFAEHLAWNRMHAAPLLPTTPAHSNAPDADRRLRVGYISPDFREHSVARFLLKLLANHDHQSVEVFCYGDSNRSDAVTVRFQSMADQWRNIADQTDEQVAELVRQDKIDILVDLTGHTSGNRLLVFARKPAPIQITYLGYPDTTGMSAMDYRLTDAHADPPELTERYHSEKLLRLPSSFLCFDPGSNDLPGQPRASGPITFGCFNGLPKINAPLVKLWCEILHGVPGSRILLKTHAFTDPPARDRVIGWFRAGGIEEDRLEFRGWTTTREEHLKLHNSIDIALDTFPYHGATTSCDALWMGVAVATLAGPIHAGRVGVSLLENLGLQRLIAKSPEEYVEIAIKLAHDLPGQKDLRENLRATMLASPLTDGKRFAADVESAYRQVWRKWCER